MGNVFHSKLSWSSAQCILMCRYVSKKTLNGSRCFSQKNKSLHGVVIKWGTFLSFSASFFFFFVVIWVYFTVKMSLVRCIVRMAELSWLVLSYAATYGSDYSPVFIRPCWETDCVAEQSRTSRVHMISVPSLQPCRGNQTSNTIQQNSVRLALLGAETEITG